MSELNRTDIWIQSDHMKAWREIMNNEQDMKFKLLWQNIQPKTRHMARFKIGDQVFYHLTDEESEKNNHSKVASAIVTQVWSDTCINLKVTTDGPENLWKTSVTEGAQPGNFSTFIPQTGEIPVGPGPEALDDSKSKDELS